MRPPIASPWGDEDAPTLVPDERLESGIRVCFQVSTLCSLRKNLKETVADPIGAGTIAIVSAILAAVIMPVNSRSISPSFWELWTLFFFAFPALVLVAIAPFSLFEARRQKTVILTSRSAVRWERNKPAEIPWPSCVFVFHWADDVLIVKFGVVIFVPREAFTSPEEAREFTQIARELRKSRGGARSGRAKFSARNNAT